MRTSLVILMAAFFSLTVSCAHKKVEETHAAKKDEAKKEVIVAKKELKEEKTDRSFSCLVGEDERLVTLDRQEKRCEVHYTKSGDRQQVAWAENTQDICDRAFNSIRSNIEGNGFKCNDGTAFKKDDKKDEEKKPVETAAK